MRKPVVVGYDGTHTSREALVWALTSAEQRGLDVTVVHVLTVPTAVAPGYGMTAVSDPADFRPFADGLLREAVELAAQVAPGREVTTRLVTGYPASGLLSTLEEADRVVLGSRGLGTFSELLLGSVSLELASRAPCPVVVIRPRAETLPPSPDAGRVVVGVDGSEASAYALGLAFEEASLRGVGLTVLHAWSQPYFELPGKGGPVPESVLVDTFEGEELRWLSEELAGWQEKYPDVDVRRAVRHGGAVGVIAAASAGAELVVVGSRGRGGFRTLLLGSISHGVLHHAHCPVMVVRPPVD